MSIENRIIKINLKQTILEIPKGTEANGYGDTLHENSYLFSFEGKMWYAL